MQNKTEILCSVANCVYHKNERCEADTISVSCDNCVLPHDCCETKCKSFRNKEQC